MARISKSVAASLGIGSALVVPLFVLEWINRRAYHEEFPVTLFTFMSVHSLLFVLSLMPAVRRVRAERSLQSLKLGHWVGLLLGVLLGYVYVSVVIDQLPCFLGVPNCD